MTDRQDRFAPLGAVALAFAEPGQPDAGFRALDRAMGDTFGHRLFTVLVLHGSDGEVERRYSNRPDAYPVSGRKRMGESPWFGAVLAARRPWLGRTMADIRWAFPDHALIGSLGCGSCMNLLVTYDDVLLGTVNLLHEEGFYTEADLTAAAPFAQMAVPALLRAAGRTG
jgi:hypothetical protein